MAEFQTLKEQYIKASDNPDQRAEAAGNRSFDRRFLIADTRAWVQRRLLNYGDGFDSLDQFDPHDPPINMARLLLPEKFALLTIHCSPTRDLIERLESESGYAPPRLETVLYRSKLTVAAYEFSEQFMHLTFPTDSDVLKTELEDENDLVKDASIQQLLLLNQTLASGGHVKLSEKAFNRFRKLRK